MAVAAAWRHRIVHLAVDRFRLKSASHLPEMSRRAGHAPSGSALGPSHLGASPTCGTSPLPTTTRVTGRRGCENVELTFPLQKNSRCPARTKVRRRACLDMFKASPDHRSEVGGRATPSGDEVSANLAVARPGPHTSDPHPSLMQPRDDYLVEVGAARSPAALAGRGTPLQNDRCAAIAAREPTVAVRHPVLRANPRNSESRVKAGWIFFNELLLFRPRLASRAGEDARTSDVPALRLKERERTGHSVRLLDLLTA